MHIKYGFVRELLHKLNDGWAMRDAFGKVFQELPFTAVLPGRFMTAHGGLSREFVEACTGKGGDFSKCLTQEMGEKLVWADPIDKEGYHPSKRGLSFENFGLDVASAFLKSNGHLGQTCLHVLSAVLDPSSL